jgi:hypothetical protein
MEQSCTEFQKIDGVRRVFRYPWWEVATHNPLYGKFVESEIAKMGKDHPIIKTQYCLETIAEAGRFFTMDQLAMLRGEHRRATRPFGAYQYVMGIDVAGESEQETDEPLRNIKPRQDSTVITIAQLDYGDWTEQLPYPTIRIVSHYWWTGRNHMTQYNDMAKIIQSWNPSKICIDAGGVGAGLASFLSKTFGGKVMKFQPNQHTVSEVGFHLLSEVNTNRIKMYATDGPDKDAKEFWFEVENTERKMYPSQRMQFFVEESVGHDDFVKSLSLCVWAAKNSPRPIQVTSEEVFRQGRRG